MKNSLLVASRSHKPEGGWEPVGRLEHDGGVYRFFYTQGARKLQDFHPFHQMEDFEEVYESDEPVPDVRESSPLQVQAGIRRLSQMGGI